MTAAEPNYAAEMKLPEAMTCADCKHGPRCDALFGAVRKGFTSCDFWPSRFVCKACGNSGFVECPAAYDGRHECECVS